MFIQQIIVASLCIYLGLQKTNAVVNNGPNTDNSIITNTTTTINLNDNSTSNTNVSSVPDSVAESSDTVRREASLGLPNSYGSPLLDNSIQNSYIPPIATNLVLPVPVYGVPDAPSNNIIYPAPPPDIPPLIQNLPPKEGYGPPSPLPPPSFKYGPPQFTGPSKPTFILPKPNYGPPQHFLKQYGPPKPFLHSPKFPKPIYGPPLKLQKPYFGLSKPFLSQKPLPNYRPPKPAYGPPNQNFGPPNQNYGPPNQNYGPPNQNYGPPISAQYGPPEPIPHGPPHPGAPAPPTPPEIKYDGWQPIPGLVSRPPLDHNINLQQTNIDLIPPLEVLKDAPNLSDSYGAPLNTVTGSGGIVSSSGDDHRANHDDGGLSVIQSVGFELNPPKNNFDGVADSYSAPPLNSFAPNGPYPASQPHKPSNVLVLPSLNNFASSIASSFDTTLLGGPNNFGGLIPPSGLYGVPPSGKYGTPLLHPPNRYHGPIFKQPKHPVVFREPVPSGLIQSIGKAVAHKDAHGIIDNHHHHSFAGPAYVPPPVPDVADHKPIRGEPSSPSTLFSLPNKNSVSFQNYVQGSPSVGLNHGFNINGFGAPFGSYPQASALTNVYYPHHSGYDCSHKNNVFGLSQAQLSSLNSNILGGYLGPPPPLHYKLPDLQISHSQTNNVISETSSNYLQDKHQAEVNGKALAESYAPGSELIKSQSVDFNNIPLQGALGSYTLQIQSADGGGNVGQVQHNQVLNDGLLQSILNAIEQPRENGAAILGQPLIQLQPNQDQVQFDKFKQFNTNYDYVDPVAENSITKNVIVSPPPILGSEENKKAIDDVAVPQIDNNEIAIYFNKTNESELNSDKIQNINKNRNGQQYGSYVSFKSDHGSFEYGNLTPPNSTIISDLKLVQSKT